MIPFAGVVADFQSQSFQSDGGQIEAINKGIKVCRLLIQLNDT